MDDVPHVPHPAPSDPAHSGTSDPADPDPAGPAPAPPSSDDGACRWAVRLPAASLVCVRHPRPTAPWHPAPGCDLPVAALCHVCARDAVPVRGRFDWSYLCERCRSLDAALAAPYGLTALVPWRAHGDVGTTLLGRLFPGRVPAVVRTERVRADGMRVVEVRTVPPDGVSPAGQLDRFRRAEAARLAGRTEGDHPFEDWQARHPASARATAAAFGRFVRDEHPWVDSVEPRVADADWLAAQVG